MTHAEIAAVIGISEPTLRLHYATELCAGAAQKRADVVEALFRAATNGNVTAQKAWLAQPRELSDPATMPDKPARPGKKEQAAAEAVDAQSGTSWAGLLPH
jgi:hypothetical protein